MLSPECGRLRLCPVVNCFRSDLPAADSMVFHLAGSEDPLSRSRNSAGHFPDFHMADIAAGHPISLSNWLQHYAVGRCSISVDTQSNSGDPEN